MAGLKQLLFHLLTSIDDLFHAAVLNAIGQTGKYSIFRIILRTNEILGIREILYDDILHMFRGQALFFLGDGIFCILSIFDQNGDTGNVQVYSNLIGQGMDILGITDPFFKGYDLTDQSLLSVVQLGRGLLLALKTHEDLGKLLDQRCIAGDFLGRTGDADGANDIIPHKERDRHAGHGTC